MILRFGGIVMIERMRLPMKRLLLRLSLLFVSGRMG
jgi:hypothetical protein